MKFGEAGEHKNREILASLEEVIKHRNDGTAPPEGLDPLEVCWAPNGWAVVQGRQKMLLRPSKANAWESDSHASSSTEADEGDEAYNIQKLRRGSMKSDKPAQPALSKTPYGPDEWGLYVAGTGNRRLTMWRLLAIAGVVRKIRVRFVDWTGDRVNFSKKCTTECGGEWAYLRNIDVARCPYVWTRVKGVDSAARIDAGTDWPAARDILKKQAATQENERVARREEEKANGEARLKAEKEARLMAEQEAAERARQEEKKFAQCAEETSDDEQGHYGRGKGERSVVGKADKKANKSKADKKAKRREERKEEREAEKNAKKERVFYLATVCRLGFR